jgi:hypothetical protein
LKPAAPVSLSAWGYASSIVKHCGSALLLIPTGHRRSGPTRRSVAGPVHGEAALASGGCLAAVAARESSIPGSSLEMETVLQACDPGRGARLLGRLKGRGTAERLSPRIVSGGRSVREEARRSRARDPQAPRAVRRRIASSPAFPRREGCHVRQLGSPSSRACTAQSRASGCSARTVQDSGP